mgnify:CR=1 FL=1
MNMSINFPHLGIYLDHVGKFISVFGFPVAYYGIIMGCSILLGALAAFVFHWSVPAVYVLLMSDELIKVPITSIRYRSFKWLKDVTRDNV